MHRAPLVGRAPSRREGAREVDPARLVVAPDRDRDARPLHLAEDALRERPRLGLARVGAQEGAADAEVEDEAGDDAQVRVQHGRRPCLLEPRDDRRAVREGRQAARLAKRVVREAGVDAVEPLERLPGGGLAHRDVGVARRALRPHRRGRHAHREAGAHEREEEADLLLLEREGGVVARDDRGRRGERVLLPEESVGGRHRRLRHEQPVVHVAEVEEARHRRGGGPAARPTITLWSFASPWMTPRRRRESAGTTSAS